ncbi:MAG: helix-turn-helix transcriptional regulator [Syntrophaceticus sp.]|nr:helix-turn-helix transcriptional regulator [Syntrophaceticus sp.]MDD3315677.1 helix-turn-helix transcriptional regulator [Syntrophaceticus sp.]
MNIADRILRLRKVKGISQEELADQVGVSRQAVSKWESQQSVPELEKVIIMSEYFGVTTDYILKGVDILSGFAFAVLSIIMIILSFFALKKRGNNTKK